MKYEQESLPNMLYCVMYVSREICEHCILWKHIFHFYFFIFNTFFGVLKFFNLCYYKLEFYKGDVDTQI